MSYSDEDILELYEDLQGIGAALTPREEAEELFKSFRDYADEHIDPSKMKWMPELNVYLTRWLQEKKVPITFAVILTSGSDPTIRIFPLYKGLTVYPKILPLADFVQEKGWSDCRVSTFDTMDQLQAGILDILGRKEDKSKDPAAAE
jgi:hypothetical protein